MPQADAVAPRERAFLALLAGAFSGCISTLIYVWLFGSLYRLFACH